MRKKVRNKIAVFLGMIFVVGLIGGCGVQESVNSNDNVTIGEEGIATTDKSNSYEGLTIRVGGCDFAIWNPQVNIALHEGLFEKEFGKDGIKIETFNFANGPAGNEAFAAGELDIFNGCGDQPFITAIGNSVPVTLLSTTGEQGKGNYVVVHTGAGITNVSDLKGKKIGASIGTQSHKTWLEYLADAGIGEDEVEIVNLANFNEQYAAFSNGEIDAFYASTFNYNSIKNEGVTDIGNLENYPSRCYITARTGFVEEYPELVQRFFNVLVEAQQFFEENPEKSYEYLAEDSGLSVEEVAQTVRDFKVYLSLDDNVEEGIQNTYDFFKSQGILEADIDDLSKHYDASFVTNANLNK